MSGSSEDIVVAILFKSDIVLFKAFELHDALASESDQCLNQFRPLCPDASYSREGNEVINHLVSKCILQYEGSAASGAYRVSAMVAVKLGEKAFDALSADLKRAVERAALRLKTSVADGQVTPGVPDPM